MEEGTKDILILGAGYSGVMAAVRLAGKARQWNPSITLVNAIDCFVERPRLHEKATGYDRREKPIAPMLEGTGVRFVQGWRRRSIQEAGVCA